MQIEVIDRSPEGAGKSTPLLFVHGAWHAAWCWAENFLPYFAKHGYPAHALSLRGHGQSAGRERLRVARISDYVADVAEVAARLPKPPVVIGHSMGGLVTQKYLETHAAPAAVLLASVPPAGVIATTLRIAARHPLPFLKANLTWSLHHIVGTPELCREAFFSRGIAADKLNDYFNRIQDESYLSFLDMLVFALPRPGRVKTPLLVLGAADDTVFLPEVVHATARAYNTTAEIYPNMAHDMMLEPGWQSVADRILSWLEQQGL